MTPPPLQAALVENLVETVSSDTNGWIKSYHVEEREDDPRIIVGFDRYYDGHVLQSNLSIPAEETLEEMPNEAIAELIEKYAMLSIAEIARQKTDVDLAWYEPLRIDIAKYIVPFRLSDELFPEPDYADYGAKDLAELGPELPLDAGSSESANVRLRLLLRSVRKYLLDFAHRIASL